jgi:sugar phosphate permease
LENLAEGESVVEDNEDIKQMPFWSAVMIRGVLQFSFSYFFIKFAYYGVYYWVPSYLQLELGYDQKKAADITSWGSTGGIIGSLMMGVLSDVLVVRSPVHLLGCSIGAICLSLLTTVRDQNHTLTLTWLLTLFNVFENGATIVIAIILCDIGKDQVIKTN